MEDNYNRDDAKEVAANRLATASFVFGILSLISALCCCPFIFSALGIIFALISKGTEKVLRSRAKLGMIFSGIGLGVSIILTTFTIGMPFVLMKVNPEYKKSFIQTYEDTMKENEAMFREVYGDEVYEQMQEDVMEFINNF